MAIMHDEGEGPGTLEDQVRAAGGELLIARRFEGDPFPGRLEDYDLVVSLGGPMNVYEDRLYPFLKEEADCLGEAIERDQPVLGICLGSQLIARALGAEVKKSPARELGFGEVKLTAVGWRDPLFRGLPRRLTVFQWHEDMFEVPRGGALLASSELCPHQAFRYKNALGLQFHVEVDEALITEWFSYSREKYSVMKRYQELKHDLARESQTILQNLLRVAGGRKTIQHN